MEISVDRPGRVLEFWDIPGDADTLARIAAHSARWGLRYRLVPVPPTAAVIAAQAACNRRRADTLDRMGAGPGLKKVAA